MIICYRSAAYEKAAENNEFSEELARLLKNKEREGKCKVNFLDALLYSEVRT